jgi:hypothetical protein
MVGLATRDSFEGAKRRPTYPYRCTSALGQRGIALSSRFARICRRISNPLTHSNRSLVLAADDANCSGEPRDRQGRAHRRSVHGSVAR